MTKAQIEELTLARMEDRLARRGPQDLDLEEAEVNHLIRMIGLQKEKVATAGTLGTLDTGLQRRKGKGAARHPDRGRHRQQSPQPTDMAASLWGRRQAPSAA